MNPFLSYLSGAAAIVAAEQKLNGQPVPSEGPEPTPIVSPFEGTQLPTVGDEIFGPPDPSTLEPWGVEPSTPILTATETKELNRVKESFEAQQKGWQFLPQELLTRFKEQLSSIEINGFEPPELSYVPLPDNMQRVSLHYRPNEGAQLVVEHANEAWTKDISPVAGEIVSKLRKDGYFAYTQLAAGLNEEEFVVHLVSRAGVRSFSELDISPHTFGVGTPEQRTDIWNDAREFTALCEHVPGLVEEGNLSRLADRLVLLSDQYESEGMPFLARIAKGVAAGIDEDPIRLKSYLESGKIGVDEADLVPESLRFAIEAANAKQLPAQGNVLPELEPSLHGLANPEQRAVLWQAAQRACRIAGVVSRPERTYLVDGLTTLRDYYLNEDDLNTARIAQAVIVHFDPSPTALRSYADLGKFTSAEVSEVPMQFQSTIQSVIERTANLPGKEYFDDLHQRQAVLPELTPVLHAMLAYEYETGSYHPQTIGYATLELRAMLDYGAKQKEQNPGMTVTEAIEVVRNYFEEEYPNNYNPKAPLDGMAGRIVTRETDCNSRTTSARELFRSMGFEAGIEVIAAQREGEVVEGTLAHTYNIIDGPDGRIYVDYSRPADDEFIFDSREPIIEKYRGGHDIEVVVTASSMENAALVSAFMNEPTRKYINEFAKIFSNQPDDLPDFMLNNSQMIGLVHNLVRATAVQDAIFGFDNSRLWLDGSREAIKQLFPTQIHYKDDQTLEPPASSST